MRRIRVLIVEDSLVFRELMVSVLKKDPVIDVVAVASDPFDARDKIIEYQPDVMTLDIELPRMNGTAFLRKLMPQYPLPVVMVSSLSDKVFDAMQAGAVDFVVKPSAQDREQLRKFVERELPVKIKVASTAKISQIKKHTISNRVQDVITSNRNMVIAIGASTGGTEAIATVIKEFGPDIPGTVIVQHMPPGFTEMYAKRLDDQCRVHVKEAKNGDMDAIESLTLEDIDLYSIISRRAMTEDIYSIVDTSFMPYGVESDQYSIIGHIQGIQKQLISL